MSTSYNFRRRTRPTGAANVAPPRRLDEEFGSGGDERLRARKRLDARTVVALERAWKTRFVKAQIGFGKTGRQMLNGLSQRG